MMLQLAVWFGRLGDIACIAYTSYALMTHDVSHTVIAMAWATGRAIGYMRLGEFQSIALIVLTVLLERWLVFS